MGKLPSFILAILVVVVALTGWQTMRLNAQMTEFSAETGRLPARIDGVFNNIEGMKADLRANSLNLTSAKKSVASLDSNMARIAGDVNRIAARIHDVEATPTDVLRMAGMKVNDWYFAARIDQTVYLFPRNKEAEQQLVSSGLASHDIRPYLTGYKVQAMFRK